MLVPYDRGDLVSRLHRRGRDPQPASTPSDGTRVEAKVNPTLVGELAAYGV